MHINIQSVLSREDPYSKSHNPLVPSSVVFRPLISMVRLFVQVFSKF